MFRTSISIIFALLILSNSAQCSAIDGGGSVYIVYAGPYSTSPSSAFGHLFLLVQPSTNLPVPLWDVVSFNAETYEAGPVRFFFVGIMGGFLGSYKIAKFHQKVREYEILENRDLWMARMQISNLELTLLQERISINEGRRFPYTFFSKNCAYYIQDLLSDVLSEIPQPSGTVSPVEVIKLVVAAGRAKDIYYRPAISRHLADRASEVSPQTMRMLRESTWTELVADLGWLGDLSAPDRMFVQEYFQWKALQRNVIMNDDTKSGVNLLRALNARQGTERAPGGEVLSPGSIKPLPNFHGYGKLTASMYVWSGSDMKMGLRYRPALHGVEDPWHGYRPLNTMEFLTIEITGTADRPMSELEEFVLFSQRSLTAANWLESNMSWMLEVNLRRLGLSGSSKLQPGVRLGCGYARDLGNEIYAHLLLTGIFQVRSDVAAGPGFQAGLTCLALDQWRGGVQWDWSKDLITLNRETSELDAWLRRDLNKCLGITLHFLNNNNQNGFSADLSWYW